jgi:hypothetical protein
VWSFYFDCGLFITVSLGACRHGKIHFRDEILGHKTREKPDEIGGKGIHCEYPVLRGRPFLDGYVSG